MRINENVEDSSASDSDAECPRNGDSCKVVISGSKNPSNAKQQTVNFSQNGQEFEMPAGTYANNRRFNKAPAHKGVSMNAVSGSENKSSNSSFPTPKLSTKTAKLYDLGAGEDEELSQALISWSPLGICIVNFDCS